MMFDLTKILRLMPLSDKTLCIYLGLGLKKWNPGLGPLVITNKKTYFPYDL